MQRKIKPPKRLVAMMAQKKLEEAEALKKKVAESNGRINELSEEEKEVEEKIKKNMMIIPNIIDPSVPIGKDDSENVEVERFGEPVVPDFEIRIIQRLWNLLTELTLMLQEEWQEMDSTI